MASNLPSEIGGLDAVPTNENNRVENFQDQTLIAPGESEEYTFGYLDYVYPGEVQLWNYTVSSSPRRDGVVYVQFNNRDSTNFQNAFHYNQERPNNRNTFSGSFLVTYDMVERSDSTNSSVYTKIGLSTAAEGSMTISINIQTITVSDRLTSTRGGTVDSDSYVEGSPESFD